MEKRYILEGVVVATDWYGCPGWARVRIITDEKGLQEIRENPLQDYIDFGVQSVDYATFEVYLTEIERKDKYTIKKEYHEPVEKIEAGDPSAIERVSGDFLTEVWNLEPAVVHY